MKKKGLYAIVVVLAVVLVAGLIFIFVMPNPYGNSADAPQTSQTDGSAPSADPVDAPAANGDGTQETAAQQGTQSGENVTDPAQDNPAQDTPAQDTPAQGSAEGNVAPEETVPQTTNPDGSVDTATIPGLPEDIEVPDAYTVTYEDYEAMSADEQMAFYDSFPSTEAFFQWYTAAEQAYRDSMIEIGGDTEIDLGELFGGGN